jgi:hypothetical protein
VASNATCISIAQTITLVWSRLWDYVWFSLKNRSKLMCPLHTRMTSFEKVTSLYILSSCRSGQLRL